MLLFADLICIFRVKTVKFCDSQRSLYFPDPKTYCDRICAYPSRGTARSSANRTQWPAGADLG